MRVRTLEELFRSGQLAGQRVFIRSDLNVPLDDTGNITEDTRIRASVPAIKMALDAGAAVMVTSHLGRPTEGELKPEDSLAPVARRLGELLGRPVALKANWIDGVSVAAGEVVLLENCRVNKGEKKNSEELARRVAALADVYVNDAFATAHRGHSSNVAIVKFVKEHAAGLLMKNEIAYFEKALVSPARPLAAIFGGAKISGKIEAINNVLDKVDKILIGGAMANTFLAAQGYGIGKSLYEAEMVDTAKRVLAGAAERKVRLYLPVDVVVAERLEASAPTRTVAAREIPDGMMALDIGPATGALFREALRDAKTIVWNGPMGAFETAPFAAGTQAVMRALAESNALTIVGGGDTDTALHKAGLFSRMSYVSTGGGAFLELLEGKHLPGIAALEEG